MTESKTSRLSDYAALIRATDGLTLSQVCALSSLEPSTIQNWIKRGFVPHPINKKYHERHLARILLISKLRDGMQIDKIGELLKYINGDADDESDDIINEEKLYDIFAELCERLKEQMPQPEDIGKVVASLLGDSHELCEHAKKLSSALTVMGCTYMSTVYKHRADELFFGVVRK